MAKTSGTSGFGPSNFLWQSSWPRCRIVHPTNWTKDQLCFQWRIRKSWRFGERYIKKKTFLSVFLQGLAAEWYDNNLTNAQINHLIETMDLGSQMGLSTISTEIVETLKISHVLRVFKLEISRRVFKSAQQEVINLTILPSADLLNDRRVVSHLSKKKLPQTKNETPSNVVRFTTTNDSINDLSEPCPLS